MQTVYFSTKRYKVVSIFSVENQKYIKNHKINNSIRANYIGAHFLASYLIKNLDNS